MQISQIIETAKQDRDSLLNRQWNIRPSITPEEYRELFQIRAQQVMATRKCYQPFVIDEYNKAVINLMYCWLSRQPSALNSEIGIVLNGSYGCGKSVLIEAFCMVFNDITQSENYKVKVIHAIELVDMIRKEGVVPFARMPLLIQDMGKEKTEVKDFGTAINPISDLLALRAEYGSLTFGSSNMDKQGFEKAYMQYIAKRLWDHVNLVLLPGRSRREDWSVNQP